MSFISDSVPRDVTDLRGSVLRAPCVSSKSCNIRFPLLPASLDELEASYMGSGHPGAVSDADSGKAGCIRHARVFRTSDRCLNTVLAVAYVVVPLLPAFLFACRHFFLIIILADMRQSFVTSTLLLGLASSCSAGAHDL